MRTMTTEIIKGSPSYTVREVDGAEVARAHCVQVQKRIFTMVVGGRFAGIGPQNAVVAKLKELAAK
jgi:hypothetical protein